MVMYDEVTHIVFDLDGTLVDTEVIYQLIFSTIVERYGKQFPDEIKHKTAGRNEKDSCTIVVADCDLPCTPNELRTQLKELEELYLPDTKLKVGAEKLIRHFSKYGIPMGIATSSSPEAVALKLLQYKDLFQLIHHITCGSNNPEVPVGKPAPDVFLVSASKFDERPDPSKCLVFEDAKNGVLGARRAGMQVVMIPDPTLPRDDTFMATMVLNSLEDFKPELFGLPGFDGCVCQDCI